MKCEKATENEFKEKAKKIRKKLREGAIEIYSAIAGTDIDNCELDEAIVDIVGEDHKDAMTDTKQCLEFYVANLANSGAYGPDLKGISDLIYDDEDSKLEIISARDLAQRIIDRPRIIKLPKEIPERSSKEQSKNRKVCYKTQLNEFIVDTESHADKTLIRWIKSVAEFSEFLNGRHKAFNKSTVNKRQRNTNNKKLDLHKHQDAFTGTISAYTDIIKKEFEGCETNQDKAQFFTNHIENLKEIHGLGPALAANFIKDLFATELHKTGPLNNNNQKDKLAAWCIKPDMHVARMMYVITGREKCNDKLATLEQSKVNKKYKSTPPQNGWPTYPKNMSAENRIIRDVYYLAKAAECAPLELDRLLYLCGSGNFRWKGPSQIERYKTLLRDIHKEA